ncbi:MAG: aminotransferase class V-fold PLP-dependent enzyme [Segetibacter sp.]
MKRRKLIKGLTLLPLGSLVPLNYMLAAPASIHGSAGMTEGLEAADGVSAGIFQSIGVEPIINCRGTFTIIGGSIERPEVRAAMEAASKDFVQYDELALGIGQRLAEITGAEWGMVSAGCAAGLKHMTAACVTGGNPEKLIRIPDLTGFEKTEVIIPASARNMYDHAIRNIGVKIITINSADELKNAISQRTAMIYLMADEPANAPQPLSLEAVAAIAKPKNVPILVDAAAEILTIPNRHLQLGATVVAYSGGKAICGPQCAGLLLGNKNLLMSAWQASSPHHGPGRDNKVGREEMMGMLAAVEAWGKRNHAAEWKTWLGWLDNISKKVTTINGVTTSIHEPKEFSNRSPVLKISWDPSKLHITGEEIAEEVARNKPRIAIGSQSEPGITSLNITTGQMQPGNDKVVADRIFSILSQKRSPKSTGMNAPASTISGSWNVDVDFFSSRSQHALYLEQDGNWLKGSHKGEFSVQEVGGTIDGDKVKLRSVNRQPGDSITFIFSGTITGDTIAGQIYMGEYMSAKFTAKRTSYKGKHAPVVVPGGPPLAT